MNPSTIARLSHNISPNTLWKHYKGELYIVKGTCKHTETNERLVLYHIYDTEMMSSGFWRPVLWVRPIEMFFSTVIVDGSMDGKEVARFQLIGKVHNG